MGMVAWCCGNTPELKKYNWMLCTRVKYQKSPDPVGNTDEMWREWLTTNLWICSGELLICQPEATHFRRRKRFAASDFSPKWCYQMHGFLCWNRSFLTAAYAERGKVEATNVSVKFRIHNCKFCVRICPRCRWGMFVIGQTVGAELSCSAVSATLPASLCRN